MSRQSEIKDHIDYLIAKNPELEKDLMELEFDIYMTLDWVDAACSVVRRIQSKGYCVYSDMITYLNENEFKEE